MSSLKRRMSRKTKKEKYIVKCPFCSDDKEEIPIDGKYVNEHLIAVKDSKNHFHIHGPIKNKELMKEFILKIAKEAKIDIEDEDEDKE